MEAYAEYRKAVDLCNEVDAASRSITDASLKASEMLNAIETAVLNVKANGLDRIEENPKGNFHELIATIDLLFELLPKRIQRSAAPAAM
jgi:formiminotetrahydrofolate cyclodeaminase